MAPDKMTVKFKNNQSYAQVIAGMGLFETDFINDEPGKRIIQMVRFLNNKVSNVSDTAVVNKELRQSAEATVTRTNETKMIAGYKCKKAVIQYKDNKSPDCDVYYTDEIELENPNWSTPFKDIKGVLMAYRIKRYGLYMQFTADKVEPEKIEDNIFKVPAGYKSLSKEEMDQFVKGFQAPQ